MCLTQAEEFKEEPTGSPGLDEALNDELSEPPPPGGEPQEEVRAPTPTVDEKSAGEDSSSELVKSPPSVSTKPSTAPPINNMSILAQKAPLIALQQAILQGNQLLLGMISRIDADCLITMNQLLCAPFFKISFLLFDFVRVVVRFSKYTTIRSHSARLVGYPKKSSLFTVGSFIAHSESGPVQSRTAAFAATTAVWPDSTVNDRSASYSYATSGIPALLAASAGSIPRSVYPATRTETNDTARSERHASNGLSRVRKN